MLLTKSRISLVSIGLIFLIGFILFLATDRAGADVGDHQHWAGILNDTSVVWNWDTSGTTVKVDFNINASLDGEIVEIEIFVEPTTGTSPIHTQRMGNFGAFPTGQSLSFNFIHGTDLTGKTLGIHLMKRVDGAPVLVVASTDDEGDVFEELDAKQMPRPGSADWKSSMAQDVTKGRRTEIEFLNGFVSEKGRETGIPTPFCDALVGVVREAGVGTLEPDPENLAPVAALLER